MNKLIHQIPKLLIQLLFVSLIYSCDQTIDESHFEEKVLPNTWSQNFEQNILSYEIIKKSPSTSTQYAFLKANYHQELSFHELKYLQQVFLNTPDIHSKTVISIEMKKKLNISQSSFNNFNQYASKVPLDFFQSLSFSKLTNEIEGEAIYYQSKSVIADRIWMKSIYALGRTVIENINQSISMNQGNQNITQQLASLKDDIAQFEIAIEQNKIMDFSYNLVLPEEKLQSYMLDQYQMKSASSVLFKDLNSVATSPYLPLNTFDLMQIQEHYNQCSKVYPLEDCFFLLQTSFYKLSLISDNHSLIQTLRYCSMKVRLDHSPRLALGPL